MSSAVCRKETVGAVARAPDPNAGTTVVRDVATTAARTSATPRARMRPMSILPIEGNPETPHLISVVQRIGYL